MVRRKQPETRHDAHSLPPRQKYGQETCTPVKGEHEHKDGVVERPGGNEACKGARDEESSAEASPDNHMGNGNMIEYT